MQSEQHDGFGFLLSDVSRLMRRAFQSRLRDTDLTLAQARALVHLSRREGLRQVELADLLEIQPINLARLIDQLTAKELVERRADPTDRRAYRLFLTPGATLPLARIKQVAVSIRAHALRNLDPEQAALATRVLETIRDNLAAP
ncbi:MAG: MarR family transcriptional regulator [Gammaproteobacteria bacterium]|nr:MarR family transcriptional regulator [Gammaproteobacteria bacterium]